MNTFCVTYTYKLNGQDKEGQTRFINDKREMDEFNKFLHSDEGQEALYRKMSAEPTEEVQQTLSIRDVWVEEAMD